MREDIVALLGMEDPEEVVTGFDRPNLSYAVRKTILPAGAARVPLVLELLKGAEMPAVVYAHTKRHTEELASGLTGSGIEARPYHAGIPAAERNAVQDAFMVGRLPVICATVAFGMGVDKPDIRTVIHAGVPSSIPAYAQEAGRAGRDGDPASCVVLFSEKELEARREVASLGRADASDARAFLEALFARAEPTPDGVAAGEKAGGKSGGLLRANVPVGELFALGDIGPEKAQDVARALEGIGKIRRRYNLWSGVRVRCVSPDASRARALGRAASAVHEVLLARAPAQAGAGVLPLPDVARESA